MKSSKTVTPYSRSLNVKSRGSWILESSFSLPRFFLGGAECNSRIYAVRGISVGPDRGQVAQVKSDQTSPVEEYNPASNSWTIKQTTFASRFGDRMVVGAPNGKIYALGGIDFPKPPKNWGSVGKVEEYDPVANTVTVKADMPVNCSSAGVAATQNGKIYVVGGYQATPTLEKGPSGTPKQGHIFSILADVQCYDIASDTWQKKAPMLAPRYEMGAATGGDGKIYAIGGLAGTPDNATIVNAVEAYDPATNVWATVASMSIPRYALAAVAASNGKIYALGGIVVCNGTNIVEEYDPSTGQWAVFDSMTTPRFGLAAAATADGTIYAFGGARKQSAKFEILASLEEANVITQPNGGDGPGGNRADVAKA